MHELRAGIQLRKQTHKNTTKEYKLKKKQNKFESSDNFKGYPSILNKISLQYTDAEYLVSDTSHRV